MTPYASGHLNGIYWECCGNPEGEPALYLHGGPGAGCGPGARRYFDPARYRAILFDQRGAGRSASFPLEENTTQHLLGDIEALREHLQIERWTLLGVSWGTTLALAYAQRHPERVRGLVAALVTTTSRREVEWLTEGVGCLFPAEWERFARDVPSGMRPVDAYAGWLRDPSTAEHAAREWCAWEDAHVSLSPGHSPNPKFADPEFRLSFARLVTHYWSHHAFLEEDQLLRDAARLNGIPGVLIHGRYDVSSPLRTAWELSQRWTTSELVILENTGHGDAEAFPKAVIQALEKADRLRSRK